MGQTPTLATTHQKVERLFKPEALQRIEQAGLMLIDKTADAGVRGIPGGEQRPALRSPATASGVVQTEEPYARKAPVGERRHQNRATEPTFSCYTAIILKEVVHDE